MQKATTKQQALTYLARFTHCLPEQLPCIKSYAIEHGIDFDVNDDGFIYFNDYEFAMQIGDPN